ncbi:YdiU family protein, partial [uncultured Clostridium sp.]|uniref:protein adenylyltransferase SelO n=1 Tax=uncultured Clostridium sp. TaxID=59620 RepID=UPI002634DFAF
KRFDIQLKGSGRTEFSRGGDGLATLSAMLREYIISEAMYGLKIETTRSLAVLKTSEKVLREEEMDGAVLTRVASSHIRVGTFAYAQRFGDTENVKELADYTLKRHFDIESSGDKKDYLFLLKEVIKRQANLIASWQLVGFIHGVMNSDNMTISGETIDYGPCAFMDEYNPATVFSSIDREGRYAYANQPNMGGWNLARFAESLIPLLHEDREEAIKIAQNEIKEYSHLYKKVWMNGMRKKLGIFNEEIADEYLIDGILSIMQKYKVDYTNTFYYLTTGRFDELEIHHTDEFEVWYKLWKQRLGRQDKSMEEARKLMRETNPVIIPRNHRVEEALASAKEGKYLILQYLLDALENPFDYSKDLEFYREVKKEDKSYVTYCGT